MEAIIVHQRNPNIMYLFEPLRSCTNCTIALYTWVVDLVTSHGLAIFCIFNFTNRFHIGFIRGQLGLQWEPLHDVPFWASQIMYNFCNCKDQNMTIFSFGGHDRSQMSLQCTWNERLKKVNHVGVYLVKVHGLNWRTIWSLMDPLTIYLCEVLRPSVIYWWS